jgi:ABC-type branched-subunit amino acid transport system substrate-binding protein
MEHSCKQFHVITGLWLSITSLVSLRWTLVLSQQSSDTCQSSETLKLLLSLPFPNPIPQFHPSWDEGQNILPAALLAEEQINNRTDLLPCHKLELIVVDGGCDIAATTAVNTTIGLFNGTGVIGMIGPGCSASSIQAAHVMNQPEIELVQLHGGGSNLLENRILFPNSIGILGSTRSFVDLSLALIDQKGWRRIAILYESNRVYYGATKELFVERVERERNVKIVFDSPVYPTFYPLDGIRSSLARIVFVFTAPSHSLRIMCLAYHMGMIYPTYQWILVSRRLDDFVSEIVMLSNNGQYTYGNKVYNCSTDVVLNNSLNRMFFLSYKLTPVDHSETRFVNLSFNQFNNLYQKRVSAHKVSETYWAYCFYDAVWAWAVVLHRMTVNNSVIFDRIQYGNETVAKLILNEFYADDFEFKGMSGPIRFNSSNGYNIRPSNLYQIFDGEEILMAFNNATRIVIINGSLEIIPDSFRTIVDIASSSLIAFFASLQFLWFIIIVFLHVLTVLYRDSKTVKASSPKLAQFTFAGVYVLLLASMLFLFLHVREHSKTFSEQICNTVWVWLFPISFTLTIGTVAVRTWRLYRIFIHYLNPGPFISNTALTIMLIMLLSVDVFIAVLWTATDPRKLINVKQTVENGSSVEFILTRRCRSMHHEILWIIITMLTKISLLVAMVFLSFLTRHIPNKSFATTTLQIFSYTFSLVFCVGFSLHFFVQYFSGIMNADVRFAVLFITLNLIIFLYIMCVFIPPLAPVIRSKFKLKTRDARRQLVDFMMSLKRKKHFNSKRGDPGRERKTSEDALIY